MDARERADAAIAQLGPLVDALGRVEGPKQLVLVTGGPVATLENIRDVVARSDGVPAWRASRSTPCRCTDPSYQRPHRPDARDARRRQSDRRRPPTSSPPPPAALPSRPRRARLASAGSSGRPVGWLRARLRNAADGPRRQGARDFGEGARPGVGRRREGAGSSSASIRTPREAAAVPAPAPAAAATRRRRPPEPVGVDPGDMADRLADYAEQFEREIAAVVAEERYVQIIHPWRGNPSGPTGGAGAGVAGARRQGEAGRPRSSRAASCCRTS